MSDKPNDARGDNAPGEPLDKILTGLDSLASCMDSFGTRLDGLAKRMDAVEGVKKPDNLEEEAEKVETTGAKKVAADDDSERSRAMADAQLRADEVANAFGESVPKPMQSEDVLAYRRRVLTPYQRYSQEFKDVDLYKLDGAVFAGIEGRIMADALAASSQPMQADLNDRYREVEMKRRDTSGRVISTFKANGSFIRQFKRTRRHIRLNPALLKGGVV